MKILYAVQATGNGHLSRCMEFYPYLSRYADVDVLTSGSQGDLNLPFEVRYQKHGLSYIFGKRGGIDYLRTALSLRPIRFVWDLFRLNLKQYDLVINDFEPITAWACRFSGMDCRALSHQAAFRGKAVPRPDHKSWFGEFVFRHFAPAKSHIGIHYQRYEENIYTPVIRDEIRHLQTENRGHIVVYLPSFSAEELVPHFHQIPGRRWIIFSKHTIMPMESRNVTVFPVGVPEWAEYLATADATIIGGGFTATSEMLYLGKKMLVIPMPDQYEQRCNAVALKKMGIHIVEKIDAQFVGKLQHWLDEVEPVHIPYENVSAQIVDRILSRK